MSLYAQETPSPSTPPQKTDNDLVLQTMAMDIASADYYVLASWVVSLGFRAEGSAQDLRAKLYAHYGVSAPPSAAASKRTITIESADNTKYISTKDERESLVHFSGHVIVKVKDDATGESMTIKADELFINNDANIMSARGHIVFERIRPDGTDYFMGDMLDLNMDDYSGIFLDGKSKRKGGEADDNAWYFRAKEMIKKGSDVFIFKDGIISSCDDDYPHYSIRAGKFWILGGNEWAMSNAVLSVGEVPLLYLPFFYYPGEEIIFNPVFGHDERLGRFVQTTTYFIGEKEAKKEEISLFKIASSSARYERELDGIFLISKREPKKNKPRDYVKLMIDLYSNLGGFLAVDSKVTSLKPCTALSVFAGLGLSRSLMHSANGRHSPFFAQGNYESVWNKIDIAGKKIPLRFGFNAAADFDFSYARLSFTLPFYSDPYFNQDFMKRSETMNWLKFLDSKKDESAPGRITGFTDSIHASVTVPSSMLPAWIATISIPKLTSSLSWTAISKKAPLTEPERTLHNLDPGKEFFVPSESIYLDTNAVFGGTIYQYPKTGGTSTPPSETKTPADEKKDIETTPINLALSEIPPPAAPWLEAKAEKQTPYTRLPEFMPPLAASPEPFANRTPLSILVDWNWTPSILWKRGFLTGAWQEPSQLDWSALYELFSIRNAAVINFSAAIYDGLFKASTSINASTQYQSRPSVSKDPLYVSSSLLAAWTRHDAQYRNDRISGSLKLSSFPLQDIWLWSATSVNYTLSTIFYERAFKDMNPAYPYDVSKAVYKTTFPAWSKDSIGAHALSLDISARPWGYIQTFSVSANLPPMLENYSMKLSGTAPYVSWSIDSAFGMPKENAPREWSPITAALSIGLSPWPIWSTTFAWDIKTNSALSLVSSLSWQGLSASVAAKKDVHYDFLPGTGWVSSGTPTFRFSSVAMAYAVSWKPKPVWYKRIAWTLDFDISAYQSFLRFTDSYMSVKLGFTFSVHQFIDIKFSAESRNSSLWRYYPGLFKLPMPIEAVNPFVDIWNSFNFLDAAARRNALFKLRNLSLSIVHHLHDWDLSASISVSPMLDQVRNVYSFRTTYSILLSWNAISQIKSSFKKDGEQLIWE